MTGDGRRHHRFTTEVCIASMAADALIPTTACAPTYCIITAAQKKKGASSSKASTPASSRPGTPNKGSQKSKAPQPSGLSKSNVADNAPSTSRQAASTSQLNQDMKGLGLDDDDAYLPEDTTALPKVSIAKEKLIENIKQEEQDANYKPILSMVVIGDYNIPLHRRAGQADTKLSRTRRRWQIHPYGQAASRSWGDVGKSCQCESATIRKDGQGLFCVRLGLRCKTRRTRAVCRQSYCAFVCPS